MTERRDRPCVLIVQNSPGSGAGRFPDWLAADGVEPVVVAAAELSAHLDDDIDGMILLGGGFMPDDDESKPFLPTERSLVREAVDSGLPLLGICLGAQVLAVATGGEVTARSGETERGSYPITMLYSPWALTELVEAAARSGAHDIASAAHARLQAFLSAAGTSWARGVAARAAALMTRDSAEAEGLYRASINELVQTDLPVEIGRRLARLAERSQVIVVTHLAQVAAFATNHLSVVKGTDGQVTSSSVRQLTGAEREAEMARLLSGLSDSESGLAHARELLEIAADRAA